MRKRVREEQLDKRRWMENGNECEKNSYGQIDENIYVAYKEKQQQPNEEEEEDGRTGDQMKPVST